jgi:hypothetical protein
MSSYTILFTSSHHLQKLHEYAFCLLHVKKEKSVSIFTEYYWGSFGFLFHIAPCLIKATVLFNDYKPI